tara:strand:- start:1287 stop:2054 length:768 start_codon:yes stop_codon:yes gene_type:complete
MINHDWIKPLKNHNQYSSVLLEESFNKKLSYLNTMKMMEEHFLSEIRQRNLSSHQSIIFADNLVRERFMHRNINVRLKDNWFLYVFNYLSSHRNDSTYLSSLSPDYILKFDGALCNQQALIFQRLMKAIDLEYQSVLFDIPRFPEPFGHFASAVKLENQWFYVDTNLEPKYDLRDSFILEGLLSGDVALFNSLYPNNLVDEIPEGAITANFINQNPALYGKIFQDFCYFLSWYGWLIFLAGYFLINQLKKRLLKI